MVTNEKMYYKQDSNCSVIIQIVYLYRMGEWNKKTNRRVRREGAKQVFFTY